MCTKQNFDENEFEQFFGLGESIGTWLEKRKYKEETIDTKQRYKPKDCCRENNKVYKLKNGKVFCVTDTKQPYINGEYPSGGFLIRILKSDDNWSFIDYSPNEECVANFLKASENSEPSVRL